MIDNVERAFASDALCSILTEPVFKDRVLGVSRTASAPTCTTWCVTGNNLTIAGDLTTRMLVCRIDPECERPEEREFKVNLHEEVPKRRAELAVAALTIIRGYHRGRLAAAQRCRPSAGSSSGRSGAGSR